MLRPLGDRVVIKPSPEEEVSKGGIVLPDTAKKKPQEGKIIAVGNGKLLENGTRASMSVKKGDVVVYSKYGGTEITVGGEELVIMEEDQILAIKE
ncbi:MAG: co-chaperone GroES [Armatimonadetes bacterium]|nr:co-chaperone GroES [Armatimonadota bacterium]